MKHLRSLYWILAVAVLLAVTTVLSVPVPKGDVYHKNTLLEDGLFFANQTKDGIFQVENGTINRTSCVIHVNGLYREEDGPIMPYSYDLIKDGNGYRILEPSYEFIPGVEFYPPPQIEPKLILSLLGGGKF
uniref:Uncharacterized protein n=1 Tax=Anopheles funestus TaxID=62324 RepID=A0A4Y0BIN8_ANOFN